MQYLVSVINDNDELASDDEASAIDAFNDEIIAQGNWVFAGGLAAPATATVVDSRGGRPVLTDGPFVETKEHVVGVWIMEAPDLDAAIELATRGSRACNRKLEVRPFL